VLLVHVLSRAIALLNRWLPFTSAGCGSASDIVLPTKHYMLLVQRSTTAETTDRSYWLCELLQECEAGLVIQDLPQAVDLCHAYGAV
jgi:hypothetical protein